MNRRNFIQGTAVTCMTTFALSIVGCKKEPSGLPNMMGLSLSDLGKILLIESLSTEEIKIKAKTFL
jgi:hypothetical protein